MSDPEQRVAPIPYERARDGLSARRRRSDAEQNYSRLVDAAVQLLERSPSPSIDQIAAAAGLGRATIYRHFANRNELLQAARRQTLDATVIRLPVVAPGISQVTEPHVQGNLGELLNLVPPHLIGEQIVAEARRLGGVSSAALYLVDIDGSRLLRFAGSQDFPGELPSPLAVGPEIPLEGVANLRRVIAEELPGSVAAPLYLRGRAIGLLLAVDADQTQLDSLASQAAVALHLAEDYTDVIASCRRHKAISAAGEIQQNLLPPRVLQITGAALAGNVLPSYDVGGDWFDYAENSDGSWLAVADATGNGPTAASLAALALGAFRAARRSGASHEQAARDMHEAVIAVAEERTVVTALIGRWHGTTTTFSWVNCGHLAPLLIGATGDLSVLDGPDAGALGAPDSAGDWSPTEVRLKPGERLMLYCDGITERTTMDGTAFGLHGIKKAVAQARNSSAAATVKAIEDAVTNASTEPLQDDATLLVLVPTETTGPQRSPSRRQEP
ncbi:MAG: SpoIIE family protein phosphatase [Solirubrobacteraceae bacterium]